APRSETPPSGTPPLLPILLPTSPPSLLLPSTDYRADVPEVTLPPPKRLCIAIGSRFEVEEYAKIRRDPDKEIGYRITDVWEDPDEIADDIPMADVKKAPKRTTRSTPATKTTTTPVTNAQLKEPIEQGVVDALAARDANRSRNGDENHDLGMGSRRAERTARECTYTDFLKCQPMNFKGTKGVKSHVKTVGQDAAHSMPWSTLMKMMTTKYCPRNEIKKLKMEIWKLKVKGTDRGAFRPFC
nr:hypothetical protein [Tanacetum cinerariifolium]